MIDDTRDPTSSATRHSLSTEVLEIAKYRTGRKEALKWARNLRFLAFDDTADEDNTLIGKKPEGNRGQQKCTRCFIRGDLNDIKDKELDDLHVCSTPFYNSHKFSAEEAKNHPQRFSCDACKRHITIGNRYHCNECLVTLGGGGNYDLCENCFNSGKRCLDESHSLDTTPVFTFGDCIHVSARTCKDCESMPLWPNEEQVKNFKVVRLDNKEETGFEFSSCDHFIAVSYCWPPPKFDDDGNIIQHTGQYLVRDEGGRTRPNRAPEDVLDRAVAFAAQNGIRLIWIDQECIDQDDATDKELGIQAMDQVYQRAFISIGLLRTTIESPDKLKALNYLLTKEDEFSGFSTEKIGDINETVLAEKLIDFLEPIANDAWHTRAWILQEAFSSGPRMNLLLRRTSDIIVKGLPGISQTLSMTEIVIHMDLLLAMIDHARAFLSRLSLVTAPLGDSLAQRRTYLFNKLETFPPGDQRAMEIKWTSQIGKTRPRRSCNAAVAISFLRSRDNTVISDRLAIIANLCNYEVRLDTLEVGKHHTHLGACILTLALINGDFSILYPEVYAKQIPDLAIPNANGGFSWMSTSPDRFQHIDARVLDSFTHYLTISQHPEIISPSGLSVPGFLWKINHRIPLAEVHALGPPIAWFRMRWAILNITKCRSSDFDSDTFASLKEYQQYTDLDIEKRDEFDRFLTKFHSNDPETYKDSMEKQRQALLKQNPEDITSRVAGSTKILFIRLLYLLRSKGEISVADAIWDSIRSGQWDMRRTLQSTGSYNSVADFPDEVEGQINPFGDLLHDMIEVDLDRDGGFQQLWVIDCIMRHGCLWAGKLVRVSRNEKFEMHPTWFSEEQEERAMRHPDDILREARENPRQAALITPDPAASKNNTAEAETALSELERLEASTSTNTKSDDAEKPHNVAEHVDLQLFKQLMRSIFISLEKDLPPEVDLGIQDRGGKAPEFLRKFAVSALMYEGMSTGFSTKGDEEEWQEKTAVFDVDKYMNVGKGEQEPGEEGAKIEDGKEVLVVTPYDPKSERLPHSEARTMSMSWVVETTSEGIKDEEEGVREVFKTKGMVKGMWRFLDRPRMSYALA